MASVLVCVDDIDVVHGYEWFEEFCCHKVGALVTGEGAAVGIRVG